MFPALKSSGNKEGVHVSGGLSSGLSWFIRNWAKNTSKHFMGDEQNCPVEGCALPTMMRREARHLISFPGTRIGQHRVHYVGKAKGRPDREHLNSAHMSSSSHSDKLTGLLSFYNTDIDMFVFINHGRGCSRHGLGRGVGSLLLQKPHKWPQTRSGCKLLPSLS